MPQLCWIFMNNLQHILEILTIPVLRMQRDHDDRGSTRTCFPVHHTGNLLPLYSEIIQSTFPHITFILDSVGRQEDTQWLHQQTALPSAQKAIWKQTCSLLVY